MTFVPAWVASVDIADPPRPLVAGDPMYTRARVLARAGGRPLGYVEIPLAGGRAEADAVRAAIAAAFGDAPARGVPDGPHPERAEGPVTVAVCTRERPESLRRTLASLAGLIRAPDEVLVVDNAPATDATRSAVEALGDPRVRYVLEPVPGLSAARNRALAEATGAVLAFTDDDVLVDPGWLGGLLRGLTRDPRVGCVTGLVPTAELTTVAQARFDAKVGWSTALEPAVYDRERGPADAPLHPYTAGRFGAGANFALTRATWTRVGPFDEALGAGTPAAGGEDLDYFLRVLAAGVALAYEPASIAWHFHRSDEAALRRQLHGYGSGLGAYAVKTLLDPAHRRAVLRLVGLRGQSLFSQASEEAIPVGLRLVELRGLLAGPWLYARGRRAVRERGR